MKDSALTKSACLNFSITILFYAITIAQFRSASIPVGTVSRAAPRTLNNAIKKSTGETFTDYECASK